MVASIEVRTRDALSGFTFRRLDLASLPMVNDLLNRINGSDRPLAEAQWLYGRHPYGAPVIFAALDSGGDLAGVLPAIPNRFSWSGEERLGYQLVDAVVDPKHRGRGIFGHLVKVMCEAGEKENFVVFAFPNEQSASVYRKTGVLQRIGAFETRVKVLRWPAYLGYTLGRRPRTGGDRAPAGDMATLRDGDVSLVPVDRFPSGFADVHRRFDTMTASVSLRRQDFLEWRYFGSPERHYRVALVQHAGRPQGYAVIRMMRRIANVMDFFVVPEPPVARRAVRLLARWSRRMGAMAIYFTASQDSPTVRAFVRSGFVIRKQAGDIFLDPRSMSALASHRGRPLEASDFYFVIGDGDVL